MGFCLAALFLCPQAAWAQKDRPSEYLIKANVLVRFLRFVEWPEAAVQGDTLVIRIIGKEPEDELFEPNLEKLFKGKHIEIRRHRRFKEDLVVDDCHLLFIARSEKKSIPKILSMVEGRNILTVSESKGFVDEDGGMVNFVVDKNNSIKFEINQKVASEAGLRIHSSLLRVAVNVVRKDS